MSAPLTLPEGISFSTWSAAILNDLNASNPLPVNDAMWYQWAEAAQNVDLFGIVIPDWRGFADWRAWARQVVNVAGG